MSLVAYGESDSSDEDAISDEVSLRTGGSSNLGNLFAKLPAPKSADVIDSALQAIVVRQSSKNKRAKIVIPSLNDFGDDEDDEDRRFKKFKPSKAGSGLVGLLPAPQNTAIGSNQLTPHVLAKEQAETKLARVPAAQPVPTGGSEWTTQQSNSLSDDEDDNIPFFSFSEPPQMPTVASMTSLVEEPFEDVDMHTYVSKDGTTTSYEDVAQTSRRGKIVWSEHDEPGTVPHDVVLDNGVLVRLRGRRNEEIHIIDVNAADQIDKTQVLVKGLTEQQTYQNPKDNSDFHTTQMHRRKHQITYLAQQAKEREQELKNMWAQNRITRKQTQAKYGF